MELVNLLLYLAALVCFVFGAFVVFKTRRGTPVNLVALGLAFWVLVPLIHALRAF